VAATLKFIDYNVAMTFILLLLLLIIIIDVRFVIFLDFVLPVFRFSLNP